MPFSEPPTMHGAAISGFTIFMYLSRAAPTHKKITQKLGSTTSAKGGKSLTRLETEILQLPRERSSDQISHVCDINILSYKLQNEQIGNKQNREIHESFPLEGQGL